MSALQGVLNELEAATAIVASHAEDLQAIKDAMDRRERAIATLTQITRLTDDLPQAERENALRRLLFAREAGSSAEQWLVSVKSDAIAEWNQWSRIYRALGATGTAKSALVDCRG